MLNDDFLWLSYIAFHGIWNKANPYSNYNYNINNNNKITSSNRCKENETTSTSSTEKSGSAVTSSNSNNSFRWKNSLGYGEITEMAVFQILHALQQIQTDIRTGTNTNTTPNHHHHHRRIRTVLDLGSGTGRVVLAAALALSQHVPPPPPQYSHETPPLPEPHVAVVMGIEIVPQLHNKAKQLVSRWNTEQQLLLLVSTSSPIVASKPIFPPLAPWPVAMTQLDVRCGDFMKDCPTWISSVDVIFIHGTVFEDELWEQLYHMIVGTSHTISNVEKDIGSKCDESQNDGAKIGTFIVSVSRPLSLLSLQAHQKHVIPAAMRRNDGQLCSDITDGEKNSVFLQCLSELDVEMSWGRGIVYIQRVSSWTNCSNVTWNATCDSGS